ncbi:hypothetical protein Pfo_013506 [Paulownia fortunei]|nr:hypothetical protein Pfo_013506 [Paulownia fortunei]
MQKPENLIPKRSNEEDKGKIMWRGRDLVVLLRLLVCSASIALLVTACHGGELLEESTSLLNFIHAVDPKNVLKIEGKKMLSNPCSYEWKGVRCNSGGTTITGIRLVNMSLTGILDAESLCKLPNLKVLSLARNGIKGVVPDSISNCRSLMYLNLSSNGLRGRVPLALTKLKKLRRLDISQNYFTSVATTQETILLEEYPVESRKFPEKFSQKEVTGSVVPPDPGIPSGDKQDTGHHKSWRTWELWTLLVLGVLILFLVVFFLYLIAVKRTKDKVILKELAQSPPNSSPIKAVEEVIIKPEERRSELMFFVEQEEWFKLEDLLEGVADLRTQGFCSSLYVVQLKNNAVFAVKRLKKLKVSFEEFGLAMRRIGNLRHPNILPLVCYNSTHEEKLLIYRYQRNGSLLNLFENYVEGKRTFPWKLRLSIAVGIARGLDFIYQKPDDDREIIPHGNIKLSNIMLNDNEEPLISEYGYAKFLDPSRVCLFSKGHTAPEKTLTEQADVYSFGVILLELLTGKIVDKSGLDLPRWVRAIVREEWTGEVFDKEIANVEMYAFPLLNVSLKCVADHPEERPTIAEVLEKIEEVVNAQEDVSSISMATLKSYQQEGFSVPPVTPLTPDTPESKSNV